MPEATLTPVLETTGLRKHYRIKHGREIAHLHAVDDVSLEIAPGEALGLVGESGCGKSTLARLLSRLVSFDSGSLKLDGFEIGDIDVGRFAASPLRRQIQMVFQDPTESLNPRFSVFDAIADPVKLLIRPKSRADLAARVAHAADQVGLSAELLPRFPHQLSGGQKARVGIARAMAVEPRLLVLDEPTSALDVSVQATVLKLLARLRREAGVALLFVSHDLSVVRLLCDRIAVMYLGKIVETGPARDVFAAPCHPYTQALLAAIPRMGVRDRAPAHLGGEPRSPIDPDPNACRLHGRCPREADRCAREAPTLRSLGNVRAVRCHFPIE